MDVIRNCDVLAMDVGLSFALVIRSRESQLSSTMAFCNNENVETKTSESNSKSSEGKDSDVVILRGAAVNLTDPHC